MTKFETYIGSNTERYVLGTNGNKTLVVIGINPSTATDEATDKTISRVKNYAKAFGYDSFKMINIYPLRTTHFNLLPKDFDKRLHLKNLSEIRNVITNASAILCSWGNHIHDREYFKICYKDISKIILSKNIPVYCLGLTKQGHPLHPLLRGIPTPKKLIYFDTEKYTI